MRLKLFLIIFITSLSLSKAQTTFISLSIVGDTIDKVETEKFILFEEVDNFNFDYSLISIKKSDTILTHYSKTDTVETKVDRKYIEKLEYNISKLSLYYKSMNNSNPEQGSDPSYISNPNKKMNANEQAKLDSILYEKPSKNAELKKKNAQNYFFQGRGNSKDRRTDAEKRLEQFSSDPKR